jgi:hypothetical protein
VLVDFGAPAIAAALAEALLRRGLVPRTFGAGHPLAGHLRFTVRARDEDDLLLAAARGVGRPDIRRSGTGRPGEVPNDRSGGPAGRGADGVEKEDRA